ncbi:MAG: hypothetical protein IJS50_01555, partial [Desulfovibrio sp.]|nr:hypothetical protein [Desulfovibrio sp.]
MTRLVKAMDLAPLTRLLFLDLASEDGASVDELKSLAHELILAIQPELASPLQVFKEPEPKAFLELLPNFFDAAAEKYARSQSDPKTIAKNLETAKLNLAGLLGQGLSPWLAFDPLNFKKIIFERLPKSTLLKIAPIEDFPLSADQKHLLILLRPTHSLYDASSAQKLMRAIEQAWQELKPKNVQLTIVGGIRHTAVNTTTIHNDIKTILFCSLLGFGLTYLFLVRSVGMVWLLLTPCLAASLGMAAVHLCYPVVSGLALGFGASVLGLAEDYAVHMHFALRSQKAALSLEELGRPLFQGFLLNLTGLVVLCCSGLPAVRQLALFALTTLGAGYLLAVTVL